MLTKKGGSALRDIPSAQNRLFQIYFQVSVSQNCIDSSDNQS